MVNIPISNSLYSFCIKKLVSTVTEMGFRYKFGQNKSIKILDFKYNFKVEKLSLRNHLIKLLLQLRKYHRGDLPEVE